MKVPDLQKYEGVASGGIIAGMFAENDAYSNYTKVKALILISELNKIINAKKIDEYDVEKVINSALDLIEDDRDKNTVINILKSIDFTDPYVLEIDSNNKIEGKDIIRALFNDILYHFSKLTLNSVFAGYKGRIVALSLVIVQLLLL